MEGGMEGADDLTDVDLSAKVFPYTKLKCALTLRNLKSLMRLHISAFDHSRSYQHGPIP